MGKEFELKYRAVPEQLEQARQLVSGEERCIQMQTQYYDTPSGALSRRRFTLRRRLENGVSICTFKYPVQGPGTGEAETPCEALEEAIASLTEQSGIRQLPELCREGLVPVCGARFTRIAKTFRWEGVTLELALDRGVLTGGGKELPLCEIEVELKEGTPEAAVSWAEALQKTLALTPEPKSKFRRALDLAQKGE